MGSFKDPTFSDRIEAAAKAKQALLERFRTQPSQDDPDRLARQAERMRIANEQAVAKRKREAEKAAKKAAEAEAAALAAKNGIEVHAGHGLAFDNVAPIAAIPQVAELNIGHFLVGEAPHARLGQRQTQVVGDRARQRQVGVASQQLHLNNFRSAEPVEVLSFACGRQ